MNTVSLTGRNVKEIELRALTTGKMVASGTIAVQRSFKNQAGEYEADFVDFQAWGKTGELIAQYVKKGDFFGISGELRTRTYEKDGQKRKITEVNVSSFDFPQKKESKPQQQNNQSNNDPFNNSTPADIDDSSLPF